MRSDLNKANGFFNLKTDIGGRSAEFQVAKDFDYKAKLEMLAESNSHLQGWSSN